MLHLLHPGLVHFPVALLVLGGLSEATGLLFRRETARRMGGYLVIAGTLALIPTLVTGYLAANSVSLTDASHRVLDRHELNGWMVGAWFLGCLFWKGWNRGEIPARQSVLYALALLVGVALVIFGAWLGGELVYSHAVGVATG